MDTFGFKVTSCWFWLDIRVCGSICIKHVGLQNLWSLLTTCEATIQSSMLLSLFGMKVLEDESFRERKLYLWNFCSWERKFSGTEVPVTHLSGLIGLKLHFSDSVAYYSLYAIRQCCTSTKYDQSKYRGLGSGLEFGLVIWSDNWCQCGRHNVSWHSSLYQYASQLYCFPFHFQAKFVKKMISVDL